MGNFNLKSSSAEIGDFIILPQGGCRRATFHLCLMYSLRLSSTSHHALPSAYYDLLLFCSYLPKRKIARWARSSCTDSVSAFLLRSKTGPRLVGVRVDLLRRGTHCWDSRTATVVANRRTFLMARQKIQVSVGHLAAKRKFGVGIGSRFGTRFIGARVPQGWV